MHPSCPFAFLGFVITTLRINRGERKVRAILLEIWAASFANKCDDRIGHVDITPDRIYQEATITYVVKNDPSKEEFATKGFAVFHKRVDEEVVRRFDVYGDFSAVYARMGEVQSSNNAV